MVIAPDSVARFAALLADRTRASICLVMLDGRAWTVGELARHAGVRPSTCSEQITRLVEAGLLSEERQGRHRYARLAGEDVADLIEYLASVAGTPAPPPTSLNAVRADRDLAAARTCYDHLAGSLGVAIFDALVTRRLIAVDTGIALTPSGTAWFADLGWDLSAARTRRPVVRQCLDCTERRPHLAGVAGAALLGGLEARDWLRRRAGQRAVRVTGSGERGLGHLLGIDVQALMAR
jgi:DNA-binding transcriptional ArsR family regulator